MRKLIRNIAVPAALVMLIPALAAGDPIVGLWKTEPDRKDLTSHVKISACGNKFCGQIVSAYDQSGAQVQTPNVGKKLFWDVASEGDGKYGGGDFWVPLINVDVVPQMSLSGDTLTLHGCEKLVCGHQTWTRLSK